MSNPTSTRQNCLLQKYSWWPPIQKGETSTFPSQGKIDILTVGHHVSVSLSVRTIHTYIREYSVLCMTKISSFFMIAGHENVLELHTGSMYRASESEHSYTRWWQCGKLECLACARQLTNYGRPLLLLQEEWHAWVGWQFAWCGFCAKCCSVMWALEAFAGNGNLVGVVEKRQSS